MENRCTDEDFLASCDRKKSSLFLKKDLTCFVLKGYTWCRLGKQGS
jgi:hypothetical protein